MKTLDCRGLACPQPVMRTRDALEQGRPQELLVLVDNAAASENVSRFLRRSGFTVSVNQPESALWEVHGLSDATQVPPPGTGPGRRPDDGHGKPQDPGPHHHRYPGPRR